MTKNNRPPAAWTNQWLRELSWRELRRMNSFFLEHGIPESGIERSRCFRLFAELARRKREGGGGWIAQAEREGRNN
jgi:hypothetical protein